MQNNLPEIHALWIGKNLGLIASSCLSSFVMRGHKVNLYTYDVVEDVPADVAIQDANQIIPKEKIIKHNKTGSYALFSDIFRYELLTKVDGIYVDCDVYCIKPLVVPESGYLYGYEDDTSINGAVLALPKNSELLQTLLRETYNPHFVPAWYSASKQRRLKFKKMLGVGRSIADMPWGIIGPEAITYYTKQLNLTEKCQPIDVLYPVHYRSIGLLLDADLTLDDVTTHRTTCIHLYNEMLRGIDLSQISANSILAKMLNNKI